MLMNIENFHTFTYLILNHYTIWNFQLHPRFCDDTNFPLQNQTNNEAK